MRTLSPREHASTRRVNPHAPVAYKQYVEASPSYSTQLSQFLVPFMPAHRIVQDSDDSDGDISDLATSIDPLQDRSPQCFAATGSARCPRQTDEHSLSLCGSDPS